MILSSNLVNLNYAKAIAENLTQFIQKNTVSMKQLPSEKMLAEDLFIGLIFRTEGIQLSKEGLPIPENI